MSGAIARAGGFRSAMSKVGTAISQAGMKAQRLGTIMTIAFSAPIAALTGLGAALGIQLVNQIQSARISFDAFMHSGAKASSMIKRLRAYATASPIFDTSNVIQYAQRLMGVGVSASHIFPSLKALEYMTAKYGLGVQDQEGILNAWVQVLGKGRAYSEELTQQMSEHGIPIWHILAQQFGVTEATMHKMVQHGQVSAKDFQKAMETMAKAGDFDKVIKKKSQTLAGVWSQMKEQAVNALGTAIEKNMGVITRFIGIFGATVKLMAKNSAPFFRVVGVGLGALALAALGLAKAFDILPGPVKQFIAAGLIMAAMIGPLVFVVGALASAFGPLAAVIGFIAANPVAVGVIAGVAAGIAAIGAAVTGGAIIAFVFFGKALKAFYNAALKPIKQGFAAIKDSFRAVGDAISKSLSPAFRGLTKSMGGGLVPGAKALGYWVGKVLRNSMRSIADTIKKSACSGDELAWQVRVGETRALSATMGDSAVDSCGPDASGVHADHGTDPGRRSHQELYLRVHRHDRSSEGRHSCLRPVHGHIEDCPTRSGRD